MTFNFGPDPPARIGDISTNDCAIDDAREAPETPWDSFSIRFRNDLHDFKETLALKRETLSLQYVNSV